jgi:hypothetical protein
MLSRTGRNQSYVDFVVVGIFVGAIIVGAGAAVRDILPRQRPRLTRHSNSPIEPEALRRAWRRFCQSAGMLIMTTGLVIVFFTVLAIVLSLSDRTGWILVGVSTAVAFAVLSVSAFVIPNHYRRGGFDPVYRSIARHEPPAVTQEMERRLGAPRLESADDLFAHFIPLPDTESPKPAVPVDKPLISTEIDVSDVAGDPAIGETHRGYLKDRDAAMQAPPRTEADAPPADSQRPAAAGEPGLTDPAPFPAAHGTREMTSAPAQEPPQRDERRLTRELIEESPALDEQPDTSPLPRVDNEPAEFAAMALPVLEPPLIDPDEELPAWNAPPVPTPPPPRYVPPNASDETTPDPDTGFESSLFANLDTPAASVTDGAGPFQSRLLNELTLDEAEPGEDKADVLLNEFSLPAQDQPTGTRDANHGR